MARYLGDDQRLAALAASSQGEAPGRSASEQHIHQFFILLILLLPCHPPPPLHPSWHSQVVSDVHEAAASLGHVNISLEGYFINHQL